jgi:hypothetical protein
MLRRSSAAVATSREGHYSPRSTLIGPSLSLPVTVNESADAPLAPINNSPIPAATDTEKEAFFDGKFTVPSQHLPSSDS